MLSDSKACTGAHLAAVGVVCQVQGLQHLALLLVGEVAQQGLQAAPQELVRDLLWLQGLVELRSQTTILLSTCRSFTNRARTAPPLLTRNRTAASKPRLSHEAAQRLTE